MGVFAISGISSQSLIRENCHNSRTSNETNMKFESITKLHKRIKTTSKKIDDDVVSTNNDAKVIFLIYDQFGAISKADFRCNICKTYIFNNDNLSSYKNRTKKSLTHLSHYCFEWRYYFCKYWFFAKKKNADINKVKMALVYFLISWD